MLKGALHVCTIGYKIPVYSFMDSVVDLNTYVKRAKELGYQSIGLMDRDNLYAAYHFAQLAIRNGLRPLIGTEANLFYEGRKNSLSPIS